MKKLFHISLLFAAALAFGACAGEEDDIFDYSAAERLNMTSDKYTNLLQSSEGGWVLQYYPTNDVALTTGQGYLWLLKFNTDMSVLVGTNNMFTNNRYSEASSAWEVITDNGPVLTFNSYNPNVHVFSDPDFSSIPNVGDNVWGVGVGGDYEFVIVDAPEDHSYVMLKGKKRGTYNLLTPLPAGTDFEQYLADIDSVGQMLFPSDAPNLRLLSVAGRRSIVSEVNYGYVSYYPEDGDEITETDDAAYLIYKDGDDYLLRFRGKVTPKDVDASDAVQVLRWDPATDRLVSADNEDTWMSSQFTAAEFFTSEFAGGHVFRVKRESPEADFSDKMREAIEAAHNGIKDVNKAYFIDELTLRVDTVNGARWSYRYQNGKAARDIDYIYSCQTDGDKVTFSYQKADLANGENIKNRVPAIAALLQTTLSQQFVVSKFVTAFNLRKMKFTSVNDPDLWFVINY